MVGFHSSIDWAIKKYKSNKIKSRLLGNVFVMAQVLLLAILLLCYTDGLPMDEARSF